MQIYIMKNGEQYGPYEEEQIPAYIAEGNFDVNDPAWKEGMPDWQPLCRVVAGLAPSAPPPYTPPAPVYQVVAAAPAGGANQQLIYESRKKSAGLACVLNILIPGVGYMYAGMWIMGLLVFGLWVGLGLLGFVTLGIAWFGCAVLWFVGIIDGFLAVGRANRKLAAKVMAGNI